MMKLFQPFRREAHAIAMVNDADDFVVYFPNKATEKDKALIMSTVLFLDYKYFEEKKGIQRCL